MAEQIFYWTGCVIWWGFCLMAIGSMATLVIFTPLFIFSRIRKHWWKWATIAKFSDLGWSQDELLSVSRKAGIIDTSFLKTAEKVLRAAEEIKKSKKTTKKNTKE